MNQFDAQALLSADPDELLARLGMQLIGATGADLRGEEAEDFRQRARNWFVRNAEELRQAAKDSAVVTALRSNEAAAILRLGGLIADQSVKVPGAYWAAALVLKVGLDALCADPPDPLL